MRVRTPEMLPPLVWPLPRSLATTSGISVDVFSSPYLDVSVQAVPHVYLLIQHTLSEYCSDGFPHSDISGSMLICSSPKLFAAYHVLHRLLMPRHSPCALFRLTFVGRSFISFVSSCAENSSIPLCLLSESNPLRWALIRFNQRFKNSPIIIGSLVSIELCRLIVVTNKIVITHFIVLLLLNVSLLLPSHNLHQMLQCSVFKVHLFEGVPSKLNNEHPLGPLNLTLGYGIALRCPFSLERR